MRLESIYVEETSSDSFDVYGTFGGETQRLKQVDGVRPTVNGFRVTFKVCDGGHRASYIFDESGSYEYRTN